MADSRARSGRLAIGLAVGVLVLLVARFLGYEEDPIIDRALADQDVAPVSSTDTKPAHIVQETAAVESNIDEVRQITLCLYDVATSVLITDATFTVTQEIASDADPQTSDADGVVLLEVPMKQTSIQYTVRTSSSQGALTLSGTIPIDEASNRYEVPLLVFALVEVSIEVTPLPESPASASLAILQMPSQEETRDRRLPTKIARNAPEMFRSMAASYRSTNHAEERRRVEVPCSFVRIPTTIDGDVLISATMDEFNPAGLLLRLTRGEVSTARLELRSVPRVFGVLLDPDAKPIAGETIRVSCRSFFNDDEIAPYSEATASYAWIPYTPNKDAPGMWFTCRHSVTTASDGSFECRIPISDEALAVFQSGVYGRISSTARSRERNGDVGPVVLRAMRRVGPPPRGRAVTRSGEPVKNATLLVAITGDENRFQEQYPSLQTNDDGHFDGAALEIGSRYVATVRGRGSFREFTFIDGCTIVFDD